MREYARQRNQDLRLEKEKARVPNWLLGEKLGVHEGTVTRWFRLDLTPEHKEKIRKAIKEIVLEREKENDV